MNVVLGVEKGGAPPSTPMEVLLDDVEEGPVRVHSTHGFLTLVIRLETLRRRDALDDAGRSTGAMAADGEHAGLPVGESDSQDRGSIGAVGKIADVVDERRSRALMIGKRPAHELLDDVRPAARCGPPRASTRHGARPAIAAIG